MLERDQMTVCLPARCLVLFNMLPERLDARIALVNVAEVRQSLMVNVTRCKS